MPNPSHSTIPKATPGKSATALNATATSAFPPQQQSRYHIETGPIVAAARIRAAMPGKATCGQTASQLQAHPPRSLERLDAVSLGPSAPQRVGPAPPTAPDSASDRNSTAHQPESSPSPPRLAHPTGRPASLHPAHHDTVLRRSTSRLGTGRRAWRSTPYRQHRKPAHYRGRSSSSRTSTSSSACTANHRPEVTDGTLSDPRRRHLELSGSRRAEGRAYAPIHAQVSPDNDTLARQPAGCTHRLQDRLPAPRTTQPGQPL